MWWQAHASAAVVNFSENCEQELLPPYLDTLISKLLTLLQKGQRLVQVHSTCSIDCDLFSVHHDRASLQAPLPSTVWTRASYIMVVACHMHVLCSQRM